jgi:antitoxin MazE
MKPTVFNFGFRRLQKVRHSFLLPIPVDWIRTVQAGKGDTLHIEMMEDFSLRITPGSGNHHEPQNPGANTSN